MGGKALKNTETRRYLKSEFEQLRDEVIAKFKLRFPDVGIRCLKSYHTKDDFGDMDLVIEGDKMPDAWHLAINELFQPKETSFIINKKQIKDNLKEVYSKEELLNKPYSFEYKAFQIDMIPVPSVSFDFTYEFLSFNDICNMMGRVYRSMGVKLGMAGLHAVPYRENGETLRNHGHLLTLDFGEALAFAGYDPEQWANGFESIESLYEYVASSPFFDPDLYLNQANQNNRERQKLEKRKNYRGLFTWMNAHADQFCAQMGCAMSREQQIEHLEAMYPGAMAATKELIRSVDEDQRRGKRMKAKLINELTGLPATEVGAFLEYAKTHNFKDNEAFTDWLKEQDDEQLNRWIKEQFGQYNNSQSDSALSPMK